MKALSSSQSVSNVTTSSDSQANPSLETPQSEVRQDDEQDEEVAHQSHIDNETKDLIRPLLTTSSPLSSSCSATKTKQELKKMPSSTVTLQKRLLNRRLLLLTISLTLILSVFWLLDSLKDRTFAILVNGDLKRHQPLAKMASVGGTLILVLIMEIISHGRKQQQCEAHRMEDEHVLSASGTWSKMKVSLSIDEDVRSNHNGKNKCSGSKIPISIFRSVGIAYIFAFGCIAYLVSLHPDFQKRGSSSTSTVVENPLTNVLWYILGYVQYMMIESYGSISVATFWSFANTTLTLKVAKKYYGFMIAIAQIGAIGGSTIATFQHVSTSRLIGVACIGISIQIGVMHTYGKIFPHTMTEDDTAIENNCSDNYEAKFEAKAKMARRKREQVCAKVHVNDGSPRCRDFVSGLFLILKHDYLLLILGVSCLYEVSLTCLDYEMKLIGLNRFSSPNFGNDSTKPEEMENYTGAAFATFMGRYGQMTNLLSLLLSFYVFPYLMENYGLSRTLRIFPSLLIIITLMAFVVLPMNLPVLFVSMSLLKAMTYSINDPAKEILYIPTSNVIKFKAKFWIDVVGARIAKAIGSSINTFAGTIERIVIFGAIPSVVTAMALWIVCYAAGMQFDSLLRNGEIIGVEDDLDFEQMDFKSCHYGPEGNSSNSLDYSYSFIERDAILSDWESDVSINLALKNTHDNSEEVRNC